MKNLARILILICLSLSGCSGGHEPARMQVRVGSVAPDFTLRDSNEKSVSLSEYKGKVVLLAFWNLKCKECTESMSSLEQLNQKFMDQGLEVVAVNGDNLEYVKPEKIMNFLKSNNYTFKVLFDETFFASEAYKVIVLPAYFLIDKAGTVAYMNFGTVDWMKPENLEMIQKLTSGQ